MFNKTFIKNPNLQQNGLVALRILTGLLMTYHGFEVFNSETMKMYLGWDVIKALPFSNTMVYVGKSIELVTGIFFILGLFTRVSALFMACNMLFVCFYVGSGKFYYEDQHPFLFVMLALIFFFVGSVKFGLDNYLNKNS